VNVILPRGGLLTGRVVDAHGEPVEGVLIQPWDARLCGERIAVSGADIADRYTDDQGEYRLYGLLPASYFVTARDRPAGTTAADQRPAMAVYYPGRDSVGDAMQVQVHGTEEVRLLDLTFEPAPRLRVTGRAFDSAGRPAAGSVLLSTSFRSRAPMMQPQFAQLSADGSFAFEDLSRGDYLVQVVGTGRPEGRREFGTSLVTIVDTDPQPVTVTLLPGSTVSGRLVFEGAAPTARPSDLSIDLHAVDGDRSPLVDFWQPRLTIADDWTFAADGVTGVFRFVAGRAPDGWWLKSVMIGGTDAAQDGVAFGSAEASRSDVEIVFAPAAAISGRALDGRKQPALDYTVVVFSTDRTQWFARSRYMGLARPDLEGRFALLNLPPADYWVAAVDVLDASRGCGEWLRPEILDSLIGSARRVRAAAGQETTLDLPLSTTQR
jgi:hypothetical protein